eukprot:7754854-Pyramimonas_sp.AAC.2
MTGVLSTHWPSVGHASSPRYPLNLARLHRDSVCMHSKGDFRVRKGSKGGQGPSVLGEEAETYLCDGQGTESATSAQVENLKLNDVSETANRESGSTSRKFLQGWDPELGEQQHLDPLLFVDLGGGAMPEVSNRLT